MKKMGVALLGILTVFTLNIGYCVLDNGGSSSARNEAIYTPVEPTVDSMSATNIGDGSKTFGDKLKGILNLPEPTDYNTSLGYIISLIQILVNWLLGILAFISLIYMLYCGFLVLTSGSNDKNASKGRKGISTAAIALAGIGVSWLIISAIIRFIGLVS